MHDFKPHEFAKGMLQTLNQMGITTSDLSPLTQSFIRYAKNCKAPVLDLGCGFGISTQRALEAGVQNIIAFDLSESHMTYLRNQIPHDLKQHLTTQVGHFPNELHLMPQSIAAVHSALMFHFFSGEEMMLGLKKIYDILKPGGQFFMAVASIYVGIVEDRNALINAYQKKCQENMPWPGECNLHEIVKPEWKTILPQTGHFFTLESAVEILHRAGFEVQEAYYYGSPNFDEKYQSNGKEHVAIRALKPD